MTQTFTITPPPSANKLFRNATAKDNVRGRIKTKAYNQWRDMVAWEIKLQRNGHKTLTGPATISVTLRRPHPLTDLSNMVKPVEDAMQEAGVVKNDRQFVSIMASWAVHDGCRVKVSEA